MDSKPTVWRKYQCGGGARWTSTNEELDGTICNFSGCNCLTTVRKVGYAHSVDELDGWFRRPLTADQLITESIVKINLMLANARKNPQSPIGQNILDFGDVATMLRVVRHRRA